MDGDGSLRVMTFSMSGLPTYAKSCFCSHTLAT